MSLFDDISKMYGDGIVMTEDQDDITLDDMTEEEVVDSVNNEEPEEDEEENNNEEDEENNNDDTDDDFSNDDDDENKDTDHNIDNEIQNADSITEKNLLQKIKQSLITLYIDQKDYIETLNIKIGGLDIPEIKSLLNTFRDSNDLLKHAIKNISDSNIVTRLRAYQDFRSLYTLLEQNINDILMKNNIIDEKGH